MSDGGSASRFQLMESLTQDLRVAVRSLGRTPGFLVAGVLSLALAIGTGAAAFSVIDAIRFRALPMRDAERLVLVSEVPAGRTASASSAGGRGRCTTACDVGYKTFAQALERHPFRSLDLVAAFTSGGKSLVVKDEPVLVIGGVVSPSLFALLGVGPELGRLFVPDDNRLGAAAVVVLSHDLWVTQLGGQRDVVGSLVKLSDTRYTVIGVMPEGFDFESGSKFWLPAVPTLDPSTRPSIRTVTVIGRLRRGSTIEQLRAELAAIEPVVDDAPDGRRPEPTRLTASPFRDRYVTSVRSNDVIFGVIVACILCIAAANLANLLLVRTLAQQREIGVRVALGAGAARLTTHLMSQIVVLVAMGTAVGLVLAKWFVKLLATAAPFQATRLTDMAYRVDFRVVVFVIVLASVLGLVLSLVPARIVLRTDVQPMLRDGGSGSVGMGAAWGKRAQQALVVAQVASATVLLIGAGLLLETTLRVARVDLGFQPAGLVQAGVSFPHAWRVPEKFVPVTRQLLFETQQLPGVRSAAVRATTPLSAAGAAPRVIPQGRAEPLGAGLVPASAISITADYVRTIGAALVRGRTFTDRDDEHAPSVAMVNEWAARRWWPQGDAVGQIVRLESDGQAPLEMTVVGVLRDNKAARPNLLLADDGPELYRPLAQAPSASPSLFVRTDGAAAVVVRSLRQLVLRLVPDRPAFTGLVSERVDQQLAGVRATAMQIVAFAIVGLILALTGVYGVLSYAVSRRSREMGIRTALGATALRIRALVLRDALALASSGIAIGLVAARSLAYLLEGLLYGVTPNDPQVFALVAIFLLLVALMASYVPAHRAASVAPVTALRA